MWQFVDNLNAAIEQERAEPISTSHVKSGTLASWEHDVPWRKFLAQILCIEDRASVAVYGNNNNLGTSYVLNIDEITNGPSHQHTVVFLGALGVLWKSITI